MIFLSYNHNDKKIVEPIAIKLKELRGQENVFYDSWSIQPGDGIIGKINDGLEKCELFLFFVSNSSLQSNMMNFEWQNAVMKSASSQCKIVPIRLDDCPIPPILCQTLYVDLFEWGMEAALKKIVAISSGANTFMPSGKNFNNVKAQMERSEKNLIVRIEAIHHVEPISSYMFLTNNNQEDFKFTYKSGHISNQGFHKDVKLSCFDESFNAQIFSIEKSTVPGFPLIVEFAEVAPAIFVLSKVMHEKKGSEWSEIPLSY